MWYAGSSQWGFTITMLEQINFSELLEKVRKLSEENKENKELEPEDLCAACGHLWLKESVKES